MSHHVGVGPHPEPWPDDPRLDPHLLANGDRRNVVDRFRYWSNDSIIAQLDLERHPFHIAIENWQHDFNIGTIVRNANAFNASGVHIIGKRRWNRRGAMVTDAYLHVTHHEDVTAFSNWAHEEELEIVGVDIIPGAVPIETFDMPRQAVLLFGQEGPGLSEEAVAATSSVVEITQYGSTRSINVGVASGIAMHSWMRRHANAI